MVIFSNLKFFLNLQRNSFFSPNIIYKMIENYPDLLATSDRERVMKVLVSFLMLVLVWDWRTCCTRPQFSSVCNTS